MRLNPERPQEVLRGMVNLPYEHGGRSPRIAVFADEEGQEIAKQENVEIIGTEEIAKEIQEGGKINFNWCVATPEAMSILKPLARILGPKGLMPTAKMRTLVKNSELKEVISQARKTMLEFKYFF